MLYIKCFYRIFFLQMYCIVTGYHLNTLTNQQFALQQLNKYDFNTWERVLVYNTHNCKLSSLLSFTFEDDTSSCGHPGNEKYQSVNTPESGLKQQDISTILAYSFMNTEDSNILIRSPTAFCILCSREVCHFGHSHPIDGFHLTSLFYRHHFCVQSQLHYLF